MYRTVLALISVALVAALPANSFAQVKNSASVVKATATADKPDEAGKQTVTITITMTDKSYHLYANPVGNKDFDTAATVVDLSAEKMPKSVKITYPAGELEKDDVVGNYMIYKDKVEIKAVVVRAKDDTGPLKAKIKLQACSNKLGCLLPATVEVEVK
jgi:hypothetical protein